MPGVRSKTREEMTDIDIIARNTKAAGFVSYCSGDSRYISSVRFGQPVRTTVRRKNRGVAVVDLSNWKDWTADLSKWVAKRAGTPGVACFLKE